MALPWKEGRFVRAVRELRDALAEQNMILVEVRYRPPPPPDAPVNVKGNLFGARLVEMAPYQQANETP